MRTDPLEGGFSRQEMTKSGHAQATTKHLSLCVGAVSVSFDCFYSLDPPPHYHPWNNGCLKSKSELELACLEVR